MQSGSRSTVWRSPRAFTMCLVLLVLIPVTGWSQTPPAVALKVAATIFPLYDLVRQVAGPEIEVVLLVPPGVSEHTFTVKPGTVRALTGCAVIFAIGHGLDDWVARLAQEAGVRRTVVPDTGIALLRGVQHEPHGTGHKHGHGAGRHAVDPHYWLSIPHAIQMVQSIAAVLGELYPSRHTDIQQRLHTYQEELRQTEAEIRRLLADLPQRNIATFHMAFAYFAAAYDLKVVAVFEPAPGKEPSPRYVEAFQRQVRLHKLRTVFIEPQLSEIALRGLTRDLGITLRALDPLGGSKGTESYIAMMRYNAAQIAAALRE